MVDFQASSNFCFGAKGRNGHSEIKREAREFENAVFNLLHAIVIKHHIACRLNWQNCQLHGPRCKSLCVEIRRLHGFTSSHWVICDVTTTYPMGLSHPELGEVTTMLLFLRVMN